MHASWWTECNSTVGAKGRAAKNDATELATDWIDFNQGAETGWVRVNWSGTWNAAATVRIYPPHTDNDTLAVGDTYGQHAAYDSSWEAYWPLHDGNDRTSNAKHLTAQDGLVFGTGTGKVGSSTDFDGIDDYASSDAGTASPVATYMAWINSDDDPASIDRRIIFYDDVFGDRLWWWVGGDGAASGEQAFYNGSAYKHSNTVVSQSTWTHVAVSNNSSGPLIQFYKDGATDGSDASYRNGTPTKIALGLSGFSSYWFDGNMDDAQVHSGIRTAEWIAEEHDQSDANATFWGSWSWTAGGGGPTVPVLDEGMLVGGLQALAGGLA